LPSHALFSVFIRERKAGSLGNSLAHSGIVLWEGEDEYTDNVARGWWKSDRPVVIEWDKIRAACIAKEGSYIGRIRNVGGKKLALLREFMGIQLPPKKSKARAICPHCGQRYSPENVKGDSQSPEN